MFGRTAVDRTWERTAWLAAIDRSQAVIEFDMGGHVLTANANFLDALGYTLPEIQGKHHGMFLTRTEREDPGYTLFWDKLNAGTFMTGQFKRIAKNGQDIWIEATYNPILDRNGKPFKIVKFAIDVTREKMEFSDLHGQVGAINKSQAVIQFDLGGNILTANQNFLDAVGYRLDEIQGRHHGMFVPPEERGSSAYAAFWEKLNRGEYQAAQFRRIGKNGREIWIEASYNPILDLNGKPIKIVKYAIDVTAQAQLFANLATMIGEVNTAVAHSSSQAELAAGTSSVAFGNVQTMAASAEELAVSAREIATMMVRSNEATQAAQAQASAAEDATLRLSETSSSMGGIVELIRNIASQINLLALNATIEAARAGDLGKGFAVVACEVKNLASQARAATDRIAEEIDRLQVVSGDVVQALGEIVHGIQSVSQFVTGTSAAIEEQSAVTREMSSRMQSTAAGVSAINDNMDQISTAVRQVSRVVNLTKDAAETLRH